MHLEVSTMLDFDEHRFRLQPSRSSKETLAQCGQVKIPKTSFFFLFLPTFLFWSLSLSPPFACKSLVFMTNYLRKTKDPISVVKITEKQWIFKAWLRMEYHKMFPTLLKIHSTGVFGLLSFGSSYNPTLKCCAYIILNIEGQKVKY